ncbi:hypothetical protein [Streptomyces sp. CS147]|uniref:hypothetical protein n=1 Tax=Streptomyces sp. CS147 TaxID=2162715 RepID=UPI000D50D2A2|nr:hypothetical protein [Streptomyces sp. CS147]PVC93063.1 hypothetical protein DBP21_34010 [Streptomyces sp. CS147]
MTVEQAPPDAAATRPGPRAAPDAPDAVQTLARWTLRPGVAVTELPDGVHLRGWITGVTLEGGPGLRVLWSRLAETLTAGSALAADRSARLARSAPAGSPVRAALLTVISRLHEHHLLVERADLAEQPDGTAGKTSGPWLGAVADRPATAAAALGRSRARVIAADPEGPLARSAARALEGAGLRAEVVAGAASADGGVLLTATGGGQQDRGEPAVAVGLRSGIGFVTPVGSVAQARADADALAGRLRGREAPGPPEQAGLPALLASSAAHRLVCAVAGLRDPSAEADDARLVPGVPTVLVAEREPLRGEYRNWAGPVLVDADRARPAPAVRTLTEALARIPVLTDRLVGVLDAPDPGTLPQLPVALVRCEVADGVLLAGSARADLARLEAVCRAAELRLGEAGEGRPVVGAGPEHARGRALRRTAVGRDAVPVSWGPRPGRCPQALHWWAVLVRRLGVDADVAVARLGASVFRARVRERTTGHLLGTAVEASADDAVAYAALSAAVGARAAVELPGVRHLVTPGGASAVLARGADTAPWEDAGWTTAWLAASAEREPELQQALTARAAPAGQAPRPWEPSADAPADVHALWSALQQCGFSVLSVPPGPAEHRGDTGGLR